jgi:hypothetical protein
MTESNVDDRALVLGLSRVLIDGVECAECAELEESFLRSGGRGDDNPADDRDGDGNGDTWSCSSMGRSGVRSPDSVPVGRGGRGNRGPRLRLRRGMRNGFFFPIAIPASRGELVR